MRPGDPQTFFAPTSDNAGLLAQRAHWLAEAPEEYALLTAAGRPMLAEAVTLARHWSAGPVDDSLAALGRVWEPDFVLLSCGDQGLLVEGGVVCFPTSWSLREKLGLSLTATHGPVPRLNAELSVRINAALGKLPPGTAWERENWGFARTAELNRHPGRTLPRLDATITPGEVWLRAEHQILFKLPKTGGVLFGIRIELTPLRELLSDPAASAALRAALESMPEDAARYKDLAAARPRLLEWLSEAANRS